MKDRYEDKRLIHCVEYNETRWCSAVLELLEIIPEKVEFT